MLDKLKEKYWQSDFTKNVMVMFSGNGLALVLPFLLAPFITRIYTPADFAGYELFARLLELVLVISAFRYEFAIVLPKREYEAIGILKLCLVLLFGVSVLSALIFIPFRNKIGIALENDNIADLLYWLPPAVFFTGALVIIGQYVARIGMFRVLAFNKILASGGNHGSKYLIGLGMPNGLGLVLGHLIGILMPLLAFFGVQRLKRLFREVWSNTADLKALASKYREFPLMNGTHSLFDQGQTTVLLFVISIYHGELALGLFAFTFRYLKIPVQVFGSSLSQVLIPRLAQNINEGIPIRSKVLRIILSLSAIGILPFAVLMIFGPAIFGFVFSEEWREAGVYAQVMAPWFLLNFIASPISMLPSLLGKQRTFLIINAIGSVLIVVAAFFFSYYGFGFITVLISITIIDVLVNVICIRWFVKLSGNTSLQSKN